MCGTLGRRALWACVLAIALVAPVFAMPAESDIRVEIARDATMHNHQLTLNITVSSQEFSRLNLSVYVANIDGDAIFDGLIFDHEISLTDSAAINLPLSVTASGDISVRAIASGLADEHRSASVSPSRSDLAYFRIDQNAHVTSFDLGDYIHLAALDRAGRSDTFGLRFDHPGDKSLPLETPLSGVEDDGPTRAQRL